MVATTEEFLIGVNLKMDCSNYSSSLPTPKWSDLLATVQEELCHEFILVAMGKLYANGPCKAASTPLTWKDIVETVTGVEETAKIMNDEHLEAGTDDAMADIESSKRSNTGYFLVDVGVLKQQPAHIVGLVVKKIR
jgi:hypothetical protein